MPTNLPKVTHIAPFKDGDSIIWLDNGAIYLVPKYDPEKSKMMVPLKPDDFLVIVAEAWRGKVKDA